MQSLHIREQTAAALVTGTASKSTYAGAGVTVGGWLLSSEAAVLAGLILGVAGFVVNLVFRIREDRRQAALHVAQVRELEAETQRKNALSQFWGSHAERLMRKDLAEMFGITVFAPPVDVNGQPVEDSPLDAQNTADGDGQIQPDAQSPQDAPNDSAR